MIRADLLGSANFGILILESLRCKIVFDLKESVEEIKVHQIGICGNMKRREIKNDDVVMALELCKQFGGVNIATMQRGLGWGYNHVCAVIEELQKRGFLGMEKDSRHDACGRIYPLVGDAAVF